MLLIHRFKQLDSSIVLRCTRHDGSITWQKRTRHAAHFVLHDLTHYAVETTFGYRSGFFGLIAAGGEVEKLVGLFDSERGSGTLWTLEQFNEFAPRPITENDIRNVRTMRAALFKQWFALPAGDKLELSLS